MEGTGLSVRVVARIQVELTDESETKAERRERGRNNRRKMKVVGRSLRMIQDIIRGRIEKLKGGSRDGS